jgi:hypothetical protein
LEGAGRGSIVNRLCVDHPRLALDHLPWPLPAAVVCVEEQDACFIVRDRGGQALAYIYFEDAGPQIGGEIAHAG